MTTAILAAVEGGILPPETGCLNAEVTVDARKHAGQDARLYGRLEACRGSLKGCQTLAGG